MLFTIQAYLEDYISHRTYQDTDGYAVSLANLYFHQRKSCSDDILLRRIGRIGTVFFKNNNIADRPAFEKSLLTHLDKRFKKTLVARHQRISRRSRK